MIKKGDTGFGMFIILSERAEVFDEQNSRKILLAMLESGNSVGEMSLIDDQPRSANAGVLEDTECLLLTRDSFNRLGKRNAEILWGIVPLLLVERLRNSNGKFWESPDPGEAELTTEEHLISNTALDTIKSEDKE